jgi:hypothetical protein
VSIGKLLINATAGNPLGRRQIDMETPPNWLLAMKMKDERGEKEQKEQTMCHAQAQIFNKKINEQQ